jgi:hypothetical protein
VPHADQLLGQPRHDPLGAAVQLRRDGLEQRCNLGDIRFFKFELSDADTAGSYSNT